MTLSDGDRATLRAALRDDLPTDPDGAIRLTARAWEVTGRAS